MKKEKRENKMMTGPESNKAGDISPAGERGGGDGGKKKPAGRKCADYAE